jgi:predicted transcriptional regulator of viral defense system
VLYTEVSAGRDKLYARKLGRVRVLEALTNGVYLIEDLVTGERKEIHVQR